ncbi:hypothetical protein PGT21_031647 [Puccinia graminis f. sp. tritici]|uniref:Uncharacterized protein n=1 Tax=Puccinia graminis f. sp. tritici TaxID=56615 RepID=A0A5B0QKE8_PUCGR|nr:hypothetical protein PGT21_031647 [Puccinia graminis f. sp. tritici]
MNAKMVSELRAGLAERDQIITQLLVRVEAMEVQSKKSTQQSDSAPTSTAPKKSAGKKKASKAPAQAPQVTVTPPARKQAINPPSSQKTPVKQRAKSATPVSSKKSPLQMTKQDHPEGFEYTKVLWGLIAKGSIPSPPSDNEVRAFYQRFRSTEEIDSAIKSGPTLLAFDAIDTLKKARENRMKVGKHLIHMSDFNIRYIHSSLSRLGLSAWKPNLDEQADSLYNVAHRIAAVKRFRECVAGGAYTYMNVNEGFIDNLDLLGKAYEHYVHFNWQGISSKERKEEGKHDRDEKRKLLQTARERAHSDDEYFPDKEVYIVKKLPFRSNAANIFFRRLDEVIKQSEMEDGKRRITPRCRVRVRNPPNTIFPKAPKRMPLDFYDVNWFNKKLPAQRQALANLDLVAFLPNPLDSFRFKDPIEKAGNTRFVEKCWDAATKDYNLDFLEKPDAEEASDDEGDSDYGGSIDLENTDGDDDDDNDDNDNDNEDEDEDLNGDTEMQVGGSGSRNVDEDYKEYDENEQEMDIEHYGKGNYTGGLNDQEWNAWQ